MARLQSEPGKKKKRQRWRAKGVQIGAPVTGRENKPATTKGLDYRVQMPSLEVQSYEEKATDQDIPERTQDSDQQHNTNSSAHLQCKCSQSQKSCSHLKSHHKKRSRSFEDDEDGHLIYERGQVLGARYEIVNTLGEGAFGKVVECIDFSKGGVRVALKVIKNLECYREAAMTEVEVLKQINLLDPENKCACVRMLDWFDHHGHICIVFELLGLSTYDFLKENDFMPFSVDQIRHMADQIFRAIHLLHQNKLTHTDLKPENILLVDPDCFVNYNSKLKREQWVLKKLDVKVVDFGSATYDHEHHTSVVSTRHYRAPEVILDLGWNQACDVWSLGCVLMEYYLGSVLFQTHDSREHLAMMQNVLGPIPVHMLDKARIQNYVHQGRLQWDEHSSSGTYVRKHFKPLKEYMSSKGSEHEQLFDLVQRMMEYDVSKRITLEEAIKHQFFAQLRKK